MAAELEAPFGRGLRWLLVGALLGAAGMIAYLYGFPATSGGTVADERPAGEASPQPRQGSVAPGFSLTTVGGVGQSLAAHRGEVVLINFWATWCGPCRVEMPAIEERYQRYQDEGLTVLGVNFDESAEKVASYREELGLTFPLLLDPGGEVQALYQVRGYPSSYFVDREGVIQVVHIGLMTEGQLDQYLGRLGIGR